MNTVERTMLLWRNCILGKKHESQETKNPNEMKSENAKNSFSKICVKPKLKDRTNTCRYMDM